MYVIEPVGCRLVRYIVLFEGGHVALVYRVGTG